MTSLKALLSLSERSLLCCSRSASPGMLETVLHAKLSDPGSGRWGSKGGQGGESSWSTARSSGHGQTAACCALNRFPSRCPAEGIRSFNAGIFHFSVSASGP